MFEHGSSSYELKLKFIWKKKRLGSCFKGTGDISVVGLFISYVVELGEPQNYERKNNGAIYGCLRTAKNLLCLIM